VIAAAVGGLRTAVADRVSGLLVSGHDPAGYTAALAELLGSPALRARLATGAVRHAARFGWDATADRLLAVYTAAISAARPAAACARTG
jgi:D-inositol-3-phosphate glycosyltransferase